VYERRAANGRKHYQYDFKVTMPDGQIYRERRKARGATSRARPGRSACADCMTCCARGRARRKAEKMPTVEEFARRGSSTGEPKRHKPSTLHNKDVLLRCHLLPLIGKLRLDEITEKTLAHGGQEAGRTSSPARSTTCSSTLWPCFAARRKSTATSSRSPRRPTSRTRSRRSGTRRSSSRPSSRARRPSSPPTSC
jgi:hypothetical protein